VLRFALENNLPNPFNPSTEIRFTLPRNEAVRLTVHDLAGCRVRTLADGDVMAAGQNGLPRCPHRLPDQLAGRAILSVY
jgi:hypothetical protein